MRLLALAVLLATTVTAVAVASGGPPPAAPAAPPDLRTVVAVGTATAEVGRPRARTDAAIEAAAQRARDTAIPLAVRRAHQEARRLADAAGLGLGTTLGIRREVAALGSWGADEGRYGPGRWCGARNGRDVCSVPRQQTVRVTLTVAGS